MTSYILTILLSAICQLALITSYNITCFYDTFSINRLGTGTFTNKDLTNALPLCNNVIYGYIGIDHKTFKVITLHPLQQQQFAKVSELKMKYHNVKFLLSLGGDKDLNKYDKYLQLLEADSVKQGIFIKSAENLVRNYQFDGLDLAYQLPKNFNYNNHTDTRRKTEYHRKQMTQLINQLAISFRKHNLMLTLTVLPNVYAKSYYNMTAIINNLDFVTLAAFDFSLPQQTPKEAYYLASIHDSSNDPRYMHSSVLYALQQWTWTKRIPTKKLYLGVTAQGRTWNTTNPLKNPKMPIRDLLNGPAPGGANTRTPGLLAWPEICKKLAKISKVTKPLLGNYAYRPGFKKTDHGMLIIYESPESLTEKVNFAKCNDLGGVSFFDLSMDDYRGKCWGERYELLKTIKNKLK